MHFIEIQNNILSKAILITDIFCDTDNILQIYKTWKIKEAEMEGRMHRPYKHCSSV